MCLFFGFDVFFLFRREFSGYTPTLGALVVAQVAQQLGLFFLVVFLVDKRTRGFNFPSQWFFNAPRVFGFIRRSIGHKGDFFAVFSSSWVVS